MEVADVFVIEIVDEVVVIDGDVAGDGGWCWCLW